ncbi:hypothetical protein KUV51_02900 [Tateyamaria omphalii]|uniref:hypothetical protein n=1 Tax=Tateyamaria omphalii TaxID=299262 RepID=UPI001C99D414|nr:hypothetical protein [Tateyamaria omphalii]MBY5931938.1 hypothetical protein [Tateyamaria omphalii]
MTMTLSTFQLHRILSVNAAGVPQLEGTNAQVLTTTRFTPDTVGQQAVCQTVRDADVSTLIALGVTADAADSAADDNTPLVLRTGDASLALYPDGRIRMTGEDIAIDAATGLNLVAARIDLN